jgi:hypothetical protein
MKNKEQQVNKHESKIDRRKKLKARVVILWTI